MEICQSTGPFGDRTCTWGVAAERRGAHNGVHRDCFAENGAKVLGFGHGKVLDSGLTQKFPCSSFFTVGRGCETPLKKELHKSLWVRQGLRALVCVFRLQASCFAKLPFR